MLISYVYKLEIIVLNNMGDYVHKINAYDSIIEKPELKKIYLGHLGESHYVPIDVLADGNELVPLFYNKAKQELIKWALFVEDIKIKNYFNNINTINMNNITNTSNNNKYTVYL